MERIILPSKESGVFNTDIELSFNNLFEIDLYYYFEGSLDKTPIKYLYPLSLTAMPGESRNYNLVVIAQDGIDILETTNFQYKIDKDIPATARLDTGDGIYNSSLNLKFISNDENIYYSIQSNNSIEYKLWEGETITIPQLENLNTEYLKSFSEDSAGNRTSVKVNSFTILPLIKKISSIQLISPVEGTFLNSQLLYIDMTGYKWIRYSLNDIDPAIRGTTYLGPVLLKTIGDYKLKIAALPLGSNEIIRKELKFSIIDNKNIILNNQSGLYVEDLDLKFKTGTYYYNLDDRKVVSGDPFIPNFLSIMPVPGVVKYSTIRIGDLFGKGEYRYLFILDRKIPAAPIISVSSSLPVVSRTNVRILTTSGADIFYTTDGSTPDRYSRYYNKPFSMDIPEGLNSGSMIIKAIAYFSDKSTSQITSKLLPFDIKKPEKPIVTIKSEEINQTEFNISNPGLNRIIYNVTYDGSIPKQPEVSSFTGTENMTVAVPHGSQEKVTIYIALIDRAGNISEPVLRNLLESDTVPPQNPEISYTNGEVSISGKDEVFYKVLNNNQDITSEYQVYTEPITLELDENIFNNYSIYSYSVDKAGNKSNVSVFNEIKIDNRTPVFPDYTGIIDGGIYNEPRSLKFHSSDNINVYYSISKGINTPPDPIPSDSNLVRDFIYFDCPVNESRLFTVKMVASYGENLEITSPEILSFEIDRIAPRSPVISSIIDGEIYNQDLLINTNDKDETVWILIKENISDEDLNYKNFEMNGILLNSDYLIKQPSNTYKNYQLSALSIDSAGNTSISRDIINFSIDKIQPPPPVIKEELTLNNERFIRMISTDDNEIYYNLSRNGSYPDDPDIGSNNYMLPIEIKENSKTPIYIIAKTIDSAGNFSEISTLHKITFEKEISLIPSISVSKISSTISTVSFSTITNSKIFIKEGDSEFKEYTYPFQLDLRNKDYIDIFYYSINNLDIKSSVAVYRLEKVSSSGNIITGISDDKIYNSGRVVWKSNQSRTVRYEVAISNEEPANVTVFSPELTEPIVFDTVDGETLTVSINVKEFSDNLPELEKFDTNYKFIIDKTNPSIPLIQGVEADGYYQDNRLIEFISKDIVFYKITSNIGNLNFINFVRFTEPLKINTNEGIYAQFKIETYTQDSAGNKSPVEFLEFEIDKANIYVSVLGNDNYTGSRLRPFKTIERALEYSKQTNRKVLNLTEGEFIFDNLITLTNDISIIGGYVINDWSQGRGETILTVSNRFSNLTPMINIDSGNISFNKLTITNIKLNGPIINMSGGDLVFKEVFLNHENTNTPVLLKINNSNMIFDNSKILFGSIKSANLIDSKNSNLSILNSVIEGVGISKSLKIFTMEKSKAVFDKSYILPSIAQKIEILNAVNSEIIIKDTNIDSGFGTIKSNIFVLNNTKFLMENSKIGSITSSRILSCFDINDSTASIENTKFSLMAESGISFIRIDNSSLELSNSEIISKKTNEFIYLLNGKTSIINFENNNLSIGSTDILNGFLLSNSVSVFNNNILNFEGGSTVFKAFYFDSPLSVDFTSNKIVSNNISWISSEDQAAFTITGGKDSVVFENNNIFGWKSLLKHNDKDVKTTVELNNYRGFLDIPFGNYSNPD
ncbi:MAG: chitobiase/beta-hexosaminidase C-terminal domain-containing protein [Spirochaetales bacterium]|nr:chitobiase/beta-hexosaminidase C-terminal domain-containing protein [Spirochaetales bacterium]